MPHRPSESVQLGLNRKVRAGITTTSCPYLNFDAIALGHGAARKNGASGKCEAEGGNTDDLRAAQHPCGADLITRSARVMATTLCATCRGVRVGVDYRGKCPSDRIPFEPNVRGLPEGAGISFPSDDFHNLGFEVGLFSFRSTLSPGWLPWRGRVSR